MSAKRPTHAHHSTSMSAKSADVAARTDISYRVSPPAPITAWAAASRAIGTRNGEQDT